MLEDHRQLSVCSCQTQRDIFVVRRENNLGNPLFLLSYWMLLGAGPAYTLRPLIVALGGAIWKMVLVNLLEQLVSSVCVERGVTAFKARHSLTATAWKSMFPCIWSSLEVVAEGLHFCLLLHSFPLGGDNIPDSAMCNWRLPRVRGIGDAGSSGPETLLRVFGQRC